MYIMVLLNKVIFKVLRKGVFNVFFKQYIINIFSFDIYIVFFIQLRSKKEFLGEKKIKNCNKRLNFKNLMIFLYIIFKKNL